MMGMCNSAGECSFDYDNLGCSNSASNGNSCGRCGDDCLEGGDMMGMCNSAGVCSFDYDNLGCGNSGNAGAFVTISSVAACEDNNEGIQVTSGSSGFTLQTCQDKCARDFRCQAIDFYSRSYTGNGWCNTYDYPCSNPTTIKEGSSSYRKVGSTSTGLCAGVQCEWLSCLGGGNPTTKAGDCCPSCPAPFLLGSQGTYACDKGGRSINNYNDCREALEYLAIPIVNVNQGNVCYMDSRGSGYADGYHGSGASFVCLNI
jgi:hypothetical protein